MVSHLLGETEIPTEPKRIVADQYIGHLLALGISPIGARGDLMKGPFLKDLTANMEDTGNPMLPEKLLELQPDLIITQNGDNYEALSKIAPTIVYEYGKLNTIEQLRLFGDIFGKQQEAEKWITDFENKAANFREQLATVIGEGETISIIEIWAEGPFVFGNNWGRGGYSLYNALQLKAPAVIEKEIMNKEQFRQISMEVLPEYAGDYIFLTVYDANGGDKVAEDMKNSPVWKSLPAFKNNRILEVNLDEMAAGDPISLDKQMTIQFEQLIAAHK
ncbi:ABC transporter substrate-binding protein [Paenibacillus sp. 2TAB23]|uniref:ABC transporter substrate-binding protein n=1 Tax=Paenibacillus sp. 2TAB23 TaxID=3233004 RepID=UPI003F96E9F4